MVEIIPSCTKCVDKEKCMVKNGKTKSGKQRFLCKSCGKTQVESYTYHAYSPDLNERIITLTKEGLGIRSTARVLKISTCTLLRRIIKIGQSISQPTIPFGRTYEVDELRTYFKRKNRLIWIVYALDRESKEVAGFSIGARTNKTLSQVLQTLRNSRAKKIYTDGLKNYKHLISKRFHKVARYGTNQIERFNLNLRTHLKRLNRRSICFARSVLVTNSILRIYFWS